MGMIFGWMMRRFSNLAIGAGVPSSVQVIEVEVDTWLGHVRVLNVHTGIAVGKVAAPALARSQAAGSVIQGVGYALYEAREIDPRSGDMLTGGMEDYRIPGIADTPVDRRAFRRGADSITCSAAASASAKSRPCRHRRRIANAICNATGIRLTGTADPARPPDRRTEREGRRMTSASMTASTRPRIPRRRHRSFRAAAQRRLAGDR